MKSKENFYRGKRVFITGHTGFKGSWISFLLTQWGAEVTGYSLVPSTEPNLYSLTGLEKKVHSVLGDIRDWTSLKKAFDACQPEIVFHMAAQPIVRESYRRPAYTYETNVMGTVNLLECIRQSDCVRSVVNVTTDKVYLNREWCWGYREEEALDGYDPYSNSKSCSELVTHSYKNSFLSAQGVAVSTARAGNVIGGGDFSVDRIIPDCIRAVQKNKPIEVRNPNSTRPYQHVLEPLSAYLMIAEKQAVNINFADWYNVGPEEPDCVTTGELVKKFCRAWGKGARWENLAEENAPHEASFLKLDCSKIKTTFGWKPRWHIDDAVQKTCEWTHVWMENGDIPAEMERQIAAYMGE